MSKSVKTYSLSDQIWDLLKESIIKGELKPGDRILELEVAKQYNVSQAPVREALSRLKKEGFVIHYPHKGSFVSNVSQKYINEIYSFRQAIEPLAIERAIRNLKEEDIRDLNQIYEKMLRAAMKNNLDELNQYDVDFHTKIYTLADHDVMFSVWEDLSSAFKRIWYLTSQIYFDKLEQVAKQHEPILIALQQRDVETAILAFKNHNQYTWDQVNNKNDQKLD